MTTALHIDLETRSALNLKKVGVHKYAEHPSTSVLLMRYRFTPSGPAGGWFNGQPVPDEVLDHIAGGGQVVAHNAAFERTMFNRHMGGGNLRILPEQQDCTLARGAALGLPQGLDQLAKVLNAAVQKDKEGYALMMKMCRPRKVAEDGAITWWDGFDQLLRLDAYCAVDVETEISVDDLLPRLSPDERDMWVMNQEINDRGFAVDLQMASRAILVVKEAQRRADRRIWELTNGAVQKATEVGKIIAWLNSRGVPCISIAKDEIEELIEASGAIGDAAAQEVIRLRRQAAKSSTSKYQAILDVACADARVKGTLAYHAAHTGREGGRLVQPQNFPRVESIDSDFTPGDVEKVVALLKGEMPPELVCDALELLFGGAMDPLSKSLRSVIVADPGAKLVGGDFSNIEGRLNAWFAGEHWKVQAFRDYDAGTGPDLYKVTAARITGKPIDDVTKVERQAQGKVSELACLGPDTLVVTDRGLVRIVDVEWGDRLWDGIQWVRHGGIVERGPRLTLRLSGVEMTPDHAVLVGRSWLEAQTVLSNPRWSRLASATGTALLPSTVSDLAPVADSWRSWFGAIAVSTVMQSTSAISDQVERLGAIVARSAHPAGGSSTIGLTQTSFRTMRIDAACLTELRLASRVATPLTDLGTETTEAVALRYTSLGEAIDELFSATSSAWKAGTSRAWSWIEGTSTKATNPAICDLYRIARTKEIAERSSTYSDGYCSSSSVYDIADAGPRNRFMIWGTDGPLLVHNCGYQGAVGAYVSMAANYLIKPADVAKVAKANCTDDQWLAAKRRFDPKRAYGLEPDVWIGVRVVVDSWRDANPAITQSWWDVQDAAIEACEAPGMAVPVLGGKVTYLHLNNYLWCRLPSGKVIAYPSAHVRWVKEKKLDPYTGEEVEKVKRQVFYLGVDSQTKKWGVHALYGGMQCNHYVQGTAREILRASMKRLKRAGYPIVLDVHDEVVAEVPLAAPHLNAEHFKAVMAEAEPWAAGVPLAVAAWEGPRYGK